MKRSLAETLDVLDAEHFDRARAATVSRTPEPKTVAESEALFEQARLELVARGVPLESQHDLAHWLADGIEATRRGERWFDVDAGPEATRLFWAGPTLDPKTGDPVRSEDGELSNMQLAELIAVENPDIVLLESTTDGGTIERMQLWSEVSPDHLQALRSEDPELDAKIRVMEEARPGDGYAFQREVWSCMSAQYARDTAAAMEANPALETGVVCQQPWRNTEYYAVEYPQLRAYGDRVWYTAQVRTPGENGTFNPTPGPVTDRALTAAGRGMDVLPPPKDPFPELRPVDPEIARLRGTLAATADARAAVTMPSAAVGSPRRPTATPGKSELER
ncbi:hypothetical protein OG394_03265 [Kribbella sp. NBC_01245]|uniref:hypothetical protein n=1 Tax=Kribbella sp. NBC_01245 TaxID=2903578 RepID=UPI002E2A5364|nr:hypothetical protein [Kribbella sp. NBC_01245]